MIDPIGLLEFILSSLSLISRAYVPFKWYYWLEMFESWTFLEAFLLDFIPDQSTDSKTSPNYYKAVSFKITYPNPIKLYQNKPIFSQIRIYLVSYSDIEC